MRKVWMLLLYLLVSLFLVGGSLAQDAAKITQQEIIIQKLQNQVRQLLQLQARLFPPVEPMLAMAVPPELTGTWQGPIARIKNTGACSTQKITLKITKQCGNLIRGTCKVGSEPAIPVVGTCNASDPNLISIDLSGYQTNLTTYTTYMVSVGGIYSSTPTPRINGVYFSYYGTDDYLTYAYNYTYTLVKQ